MSCLCFGEFAKIIKKATLMEDIDVVNELLGGIIIPLDLRNKNNHRIYYEKKETSDLINSKMNIPSEIKKSIKCVQNSIVQYFENKIVSRISIHTPTHLMDNVFKLIINDVSVPVADRNRLSGLAKENTLCEFLSEVFLYTLQVPNDFNLPLDKKLKEISIRPPLLSDTETYLLSEVNACCPICGNSFIKIKNGKSIPIFCITEIYPLNPTANQLSVLEEIDMPNYSLDSIENKIALCQDCKNSYFYSFSKDEYYKMISLKSEVSKLFKAQMDIDRIELETVLSDVIKKITQIEQKDLTNKLLLDALKIENKLLPSETILKMKIEFYVTTYYNYINDLFGQYSKTTSFDFDMLAQEIKFCCDKLIKKGLSNTEIFSKMVNWIKNKTSTKNEIASEAIISFFVQNCEVFHEIS